mmetsp:Transcript_3489/g.12514  ORF Transcript_3489/g.12514 Transcript_3489/m.12514 type:complete len:400 (-) Transcript_3489:1526-2725(-)
MVRCLACGGWSEAEGGRGGLVVRGAGEPRDGSGDELREDAFGGGAELGALIFPELLEQRAREVVGVPALLLLRPRRRRRRADASLPARGGERGAFGAVEGVLRGARHRLEPRRAPARDDAECYRRRRLGLCERIPAQDRRRLAPERRLREVHERACVELLLERELGRRRVEHLPRAEQNRDHSADGRRCRRRGRGALARGGRVRRRARRVRRRPRRQEHGRGDLLRFGEEWERLRRERSEEAREGFARALAQQEIRTVHRLLLDEAADRARLRGEEVLDGVAERDAVLGDGVKVDEGGFGFGDDAQRAVDDDGEPLAAEGTAALAARRRVQHLLQRALQLRPVLAQQLTRHKGVCFHDKFVIGIADEREAFERDDGAREKGKVRRDAERDVVDHGEEVL